MPLAAAFFASLAAHVSIDIAGDFVLAHDTYDDPAHGSRWLASIALAICALGALGVLARAVVAETRGCRGALRRALSASLPRSAAAFALIVAGAALPLLAGMAWLDDACAGIRVDDVADLFGGSIPLGAGITVALAFAAAACAHRFVAVLSRYHRAIVRAVETFVRIALQAGAAPRFLLGDRRPDRPRVPSAFVRSSGANRAPPGRSLQPLLP